MYVDLHIHTYFSDGVQSPEQVVAVAKQKGLSVISVCDHNTIGAYERLGKACTAAGIQLIQGAELDAAWENEQKFHLLAYNFDPAYPPLLKLLQDTLHQFAFIDRDLIRNMQADYPAVSLAEYDAYTMPKGRGGWKSINYIYDKGLSKGVAEAIPFHRQYDAPASDFTTVKEVCRIVRAAGGVTVLAHPGVYWQEGKLPDADSLTQKLARLKNNGINGIECYHPRHSPALTDLCVSFCEANDMYISCGGDGHGGFGSPFMGCHYDIGIMKTDMEGAMKKWENILF